MSVSVAQAVRQHAEDLKEELEGLNEWVREMAELRETKAQPGLTLASAEVEVPIRGTVPSIKQALAQMDGKEAKKVPPQQDPIQIQKEKGNEYFRIGKNIDAIEAYTAGIELNPKGEIAHVLYANRAMCLIREKQWEKAEKDASACIQLNRRYAKGYFRRAVARKNLNDFKGARADLESVLALVPKDASALEELNIVTKMLQSEREKVTAPAITRRRIVIEEVENTDEEELIPINTSEEDKQREEQAKENMQNLKRIIEDKNRSQLENTQRQVKEMETKLRRNARVEVIEAPEEDATPHKSSKLDTDTSSPQKTSDGVTEKEASVSEKASLPTPEADNVKVQVDPLPATQLNKLTNSVKPRPTLTKESLKLPKTFIEFERVFSQIESNDELRNHFVSSINPALFPSLFGSNMTPEIFTGILRTIKQLPGSSALQYLKGVSRVHRIEDITLFLNTEEKKLLDDIFCLLKNCGIAEKELMPIERKLKIF